MSTWTPQDWKSWGCPHSLGSRKARRYHTLLQYTCNIPSACISSESYNWLNCSAAHAGAPCCLACHLAREHATCPLQSCILCCHLLVHTRLAGHFVRDGQRRLVQGNKKRQQPSTADSLNTACDISVTAAAICGTAEQLAFPLTTSNDAPAAQNLQAALGTAEIEANIGLSGPACNSTVASMQHDCHFLPEAGQLAAIAGESLAPNEQPEQDAMPPPFSQSTAPASSPLQLEDSKAAKFDLRDGHSRPHLENSTLLQCSPTGPSSGPDARSMPTPVSEDSHAGLSPQLQGLPEPTGSHIRFDSDDDDNMPSAAAGALHSLNSASGITLYG